jgi:hypothetical protein
MAWTDSPKMQDLSASAADSMWCTSQGAGNMTSGRPSAMSAPGSVPVDPMPPAKEQGDPHVQATEYDGRHTVRGSG